MTTVTVYQTKSGTFTKRRATTKWEAVVLGGEQYVRDAPTGECFTPVELWGVMDRNKVRQVFNSRKDAREYRRAHCNLTGKVVALGILSQSC